MHTSRAEIESRWDEAHEMASYAREVLIAIGVPAAELDLLTARASISGPRIILPPLSMASMATLLRALGPSLGPELALRYVPSAVGTHPA